MTEDVSKNTIALLLILALIVAGIGVGIAINNYQSINTAAYKEINTAPAEPSSSSGQVGVIVVPREEGESANG